MASLQVPFTYNLINKITLLSNAFKYGELCGVIHIRCRHIFTYTKLQTEHHYLHHSTIGLFVRSPVYRATTINFTTQASSLCTASAGAFPPPSGADLGFAEGRG